MLCFSFLHWSYLARRRWGNITGYGRYPSDYSFPSWGRPPVGQLLALPILYGGKDGKVYAEELVTEGMFSHCRNPLYAGNILMLVGVGILRNSLIYVCAVIPVFLFIYQAIVLAEESFLSGYLGDAHAVYCKKVNRWVPSLPVFPKPLKVRSSTGNAGY